MQSLYLPPLPSPPLPSPPLPTCLVALQRDSEAVMGVYLERLFLESEKERKEKENQERQQAAQIAAG